jgi:hypothetical protein
MVASFTHRVLQMDQAQRDRAGELLGLVEKEIAKLKAEAVKIEARFFVENKCPIEQTGVSRRFEMALKATETMKAGLQRNPLLPHDHGVFTFSTVEFLGPLGKAS